MAWLVVSQQVQSLFYVAMTAAARGRGGVDPEGTPLAGAVDGETGGSNRRSSAARAGTGQSEGQGIAGES
jgi:hypothetical protein